jgi:hypothetical protein
MGASINRTRINRISNREQIGEQRASETKKRSPSKAIRPAGIRKIRIVDQAPEQRIEPQ